MIDISDGLVQDLGHICAAADLGAAIELSDLPLTAAARALAPRVGLDPLLTAAGFGDDYQLLACIHPTSLEWLHSQIPGLIRIGEIAPGSGVSITQDGRPVHLPRGGYEHGVPTTSE